MTFRHSFTLGDQTYTLETGAIARQAGGAVRLEVSDTVLLATVVAARDVRPGANFLPLTVDYVEKAYAGGRIPGGVLRREAAPTEKETLTCRLIDRAIRPFFPKAFRNEIQVVVQVLSAHPEVDPDVPAFIAASAAIAVSGIPFDGPVGAVRVGYRDGRYEINPTRSDLAAGALDLVVAGTADAVAMVESGAHELSEEVMLGAVTYGHEQLGVAVEAIRALTAAAAPQPWDWQPEEADALLSERVEALARPLIEKAYEISDKPTRSTALRIVRDVVGEDLLRTGTTVRTTDIDDILYMLEKSVVRGRILAGQPRIDGRDRHTVRPLAMRTGVLPRSHGSALFTRGETQVLAVVTLGSERDRRIVEDLHGRHTDSLMLQYNMPPFATGEAGRFGTPKRREIGHGRLARRALAPLIPTQQDFPYTLRVVCEVTESNGSSSMASVCGACMALRDAGVPLAANAAGIAMGLIVEGDRVAVLTDILGDEDHLGDMDFKVAGTERGITALQMDIKVRGVQPAVMREALDEARKARLMILSRMDEACDGLDNELSDFAPRTETLKIPIARIRDVIGKGGAVIRGMMEESGATIDVADDGTVSISAADMPSIEIVRKRIEALTAEVEPGQVCDGLVRKVVAAGAFIEVMPGRDGFLPADEFERLVEGQTQRVRVVETDARGRIRLTSRIEDPLPTEVEGE